MSCIFYIGISHLLTNVMEEVLCMERHGLNGQIEDENYCLDLIDQLDEKWVKYIDNLPLKFAIKECISGINRLERQKLRSCAQMNIRVNVGDVCFIDFGQAYIHEAGYQHFGVVLKLVNNKAFVVPMTSNETTYMYAEDVSRHQYGKNHLHQMGWIEGLNKRSVCFVNDCKFINTARIIDIKGHIPPTSPIFLELKDRVMECIS